MLVRVTEHTRYRCHERLEMAHAVIQYSLRNWKG